MPSVATRALRLPLRWFAGAVVVVALAGSAMFHGLSPVAASPDTAAAVGSRIAGGPWDVTVITGRLLASQDGLRTDKAGDRWLVVLATIEVTATESRNDLPDIFRLPRASGLLTKSPERVLLARDSTDLGYLNPGMPERVAFLWEQRASAPVPTTVDIEVYGKTLRTDSLTGSAQWLDLTVRSTVHAPVQDKRT